MGGRVKVEKNNAFSRNGPKKIGVKISVIFDSDVFCRKFMSAIAWILLVIFCQENPDVS